MQNHLGHVRLFMGAALFTAIALGQSRTGTVKGTLADESGAIIPAVTVTLTGSAGAQTAQTQADGSYSFANLAPGQYTVSLNYSGFAPFSATVKVVAGASVQVPIKLSVGAEVQKVTVSAETGSTVSVEPENNATALVIKGEDLQALPDDPDDLTSALQALAGPGAGPNGGQIYIDGFSGGQLPPLRRGSFVQDDWRAKPNLTVSFGLRYEVQTLISDYRDVAPRFGFAWAPHQPKKASPQARNVK
jgi:hypothetical protein